MALQRSRRDKRLRAKAADAVDDWRMPVDPTREEVMAAIARKVADEDVPVWWRDKSLASIGLIECRTFGRHRAINDWDD